MKLFLVTLFVCFAIGVPSLSFAQQSQANPDIFNPNGSNQSQANPPIFPQNAAANTDGNGTGGQSGGTDGNGTGGTVKIDNPLIAEDINALFVALIKIVLIFAIPIVVFFIIYAGFLYVTAQGNEEQISKAHKALLYAIIGGVIILGANVLITVIEETVKEISNIN